MINISTIIVLASVDGSVFEKSYIGSQFVSCTFHSVTCYFVRGGQSVGPVMMFVQNISTHCQLHTDSNLFKEISLSLSLSSVSNSGIIATFSKWNVSVLEACPSLLVSCHNDQEWKIEEELNVCVALIHATWILHPDFLKSEFSLPTIDAVCIIPFD